MPDTSGHRTVYYSDEENAIVESGLGAISVVLTGRDMPAKERLLLCLDKYLDPYFKYNLPYKQDIERLLVAQLFEPNTLEVKEDILDLLALYSSIPLDDLKDNIDKLEPSLQPLAKSLLC